MVLSRGLLVCYGRLWPKKHILGNFPNARTCNSNLCFGNRCHAPDRPRGLLLDPGAFGHALRCHCNQTLFTAGHL
eukprot:238114-Lingulodinium_polyedra.AAC.1